MKVLIINSKKVNAQGRSNALLLVRRRIGSKVVDMRAKTNIDLDIDRFDIAGKTIKEYRKNIVNTPDVKYNKEQIKKIKGHYRFCPWIAHAKLLAKYHRATVQEERQVTYTPKFGSEAFHL